MVERAVKKARLCQKTGKNERNVTAYGIAGDGVTEKCDKQLVKSEYMEKMKEKREELKAKAIVAGRETRVSDLFEEDILRGPSLSKNIFNHALHLYQQVQELEEKIGHDEYERRFKISMDMIQNVDRQGSSKRMNDNLEEFKRSLGKEYKESRRQLENGVTRTPYMLGNVPIRKLLKSQNYSSLVCEARARNLVSNNDESNLGWRELVKLIKDDEKRKWIANNPGKEVPDHVGKHFKSLSGATFLWE